ncbi:COX15/CtaA family protein [Candidatus Enterovibrio escicola]|uniref:Heme A synthase, cytochrome oxidase biogenesis protein n=1 Tax=Candidatus Enterovibrio escicola TaxID=1927127 RepID=A0A2A5T4X6_9GAMM|nr:COX15/CtaA family protein [Candidatus Enterovibrio escacola]PCS23212.1 Heme A synthase, cytochrome oxidase biogenesis protein [Candidatus Enterovibrio escacola]
MARNKYYQTLIYSVFILAVLVVGLGVFTRLTEAGLGCPDWPGCFGFLTVPQSQERLSQVAVVFPDIFVDIQKAWNEMVHRYMAGLLGLLIAAITFLAWRKSERNKVLPSVLLVVVLLQAVLGMLTVTMNLMPIVVMGHLLGGFITVSLLFLLAIVENQRISKTTQYLLSMTNLKTVSTMKSFSIENVVRKLTTTFSIKVLAISALIAVVLQIVLGGWTSANYASSVCTQLPVCEVDWVSKYDISAFHPVSPTKETYQYGVLNFEQRVTIHATHCIGSMIVSMLVLLLAMAVRHSLGIRAALGLSASLLLQILLGVTNVVAQLPLSVAVAHNLCGMLLLLVMLRITVRIFMAPTSAVHVSVKKTGRLNRG